MPSRVRQVTKKTGDSSLAEPVNIGVLARDVVDLRPDQGTRYDQDTMATGYTLSQLIDHYMLFMEEVPFIYIGGADDQVHNSISNSHIGIWIDTGETSSDYWNTRE